MEIFDKFEDKWESAAKIVWIVLGNIIYAVSINFLITPMSLYNGGFLGIAQLLRSFMVNVMGVSVSSNIDITGIIYFIMNVPLFYYAYRAVGAKFALKTVLSIGLSSLCLTFVPVPDTPVFSDYLTACVVGGVIGGVGCGMILRGGSSTGGSDIIGMCMAKTHPNASVGKINVIFNLFVYAICLFAFNIEIAVYSFIYTTIRSSFMDRMHAQNITTEVMIVTKVDGIDKKINDEMGRGVTRWDGIGTYTGDDVNVLVSLVSKYEITHLKHIVLDMDPHAFIMMSDGETIEGNFKKHLD
jgi:uncharacterized membrane-anchored protein YitT (DUF2179 family)